MKVYIDSKRRCHSTNPDGSFREVEIDFFNGKCDAFIEGYRFVPSGETWTREDGVKFTGEMFTPWKDYNELNEAQREYELQQIKEMTITIARLDEALLDATYSNIVGGK